MKKCCAAGASSIGDSVEVSDDCDDEHRCRQLFGGIELCCLDGSARIAHPNGTCHYTEVRPRRQGRKDSLRSRYGSALESMAICVCDDGGWGAAARRSCAPECMAGDLDCVFCNLIASMDHAIEHGMNADEAEEAGGLVKRGKTLLHLPECVSVHLGARDGDALCAPGPAWRN